MTIDDVNRFVAVVETGSINKAAEKFYLPQPAVSRSIKRMEDEYGITLFERSQGKKSILSHEGQIVYNAAKQIQLIHENLSLQLQLYKMRTENMIVFGMTQQQGITLFRELHQYFYTHEPNYQLNIRMDRAHNLHMGILHGDIDAALISVDRKCADLYYGERKAMYTHLYLAKDSPLIGKLQTREGLDLPVLRIQDLENESLIVAPKGAASRSFLESLLTKYNVRVQLIEEADMYQRMRLADLGAGTYVLSTSNSDMNRIRIGERTRFARLDPEQDVGNFRYLVCRNGFEESEKYRALCRCFSVRSG